MSNESKNAEKAPLKKDQKKKEKKVEDPFVTEAKRLIRVKTVLWYALYVQTLHEITIRGKINSLGKELYVFVDRYIKGFIFDRILRQSIVIPDDVMMGFIQTCKEEKYVSVTMGVPTVGKKVKILVGALADRVGYLVKKNGAHRFQMYVKELTFSFEVKESDIVVIE